MAKCALGYILTLNYYVFEHEKQNTHGILEWGENWLSLRQHELRVASVIGLVDWVTHLIMLSPEQ